MPLPTPRTMPSPQMGGFLPDDPVSAAGYRDSSELVGALRVGAVSRVELAQTPPLVQWWQDCVANAAADAYMFELLVTGLIPEPARLFVDPTYYEEWLPSRRKIYWDARAASGSERVDTGTQPSALVRALRDKGVCAEKYCPYDGVPEENPLADHDDAGRMSMDQAGRVELFTCSDFDAVLAAITSGHRVLYAAPVFDSMRDVGFEEIYVPKGARLGLHMWQLVGFEDHGRVVRMKNQWPGWGGEKQEAFAERSTLETSMLTALAFARVARYSEASK